jgi:hypothetical protein
MFSIAAVALESSSIAQGLLTRPTQPGIPARTRASSNTDSQTGAGAPPLPALDSWQDHWELFLDETGSPLSAGGTIFNASFSHLTRSDPRYGSNVSAFGQRVGASAADIAAQNFFSDFLVASVLHEDPRYGEEYGFWNRFTYAITRALVIRKTTGGTSFNWDNTLGSAMSAGFRTCIIRRRAGPEARC